jgi:hypothetical protein
MTILQFQELYYIAQGKDIDIDKSIKMVGVITGQTPAQVEKMPMAKFNRICANITKSFEHLSSHLLKTKPQSIVFVKGRFYRLHYRIDREPINAGKYVEAVTFGKDVVENLHKIMATIATPITWRGKEYSRPHEDIAKDFESMDFKAAYHAAVFFYTHYRVSMQIIQPYLVKELVAKGQSREEVEVILNNSLTILDGFTMPKWSLNLRQYLLNRYGA